MRRPSISYDRLGSMSMAPLPKAGGDFNVVFIGAGNIHFGSPEGPWNHSFRLEHKLGPRLKVIGLVDPARSRAEDVLSKKMASFVASAYKDTKIFANWDECVAGLKAAKEAPHAVMIGSPAAFHGSTQPGADLELQVLKAFPNAALFVEKPISASPVPTCLELAQIIEDRRTVCSVGYMLRYLKVVQRMKNILEENNLTVMATVARYVCSYAKIASPVWWTKSKSCGPIVEQGTHFVDLSRYFGGEVMLDSVQASSLEWYEEAGKLDVVPVDEEKIAEDDRVPRVTSATWKYENGAVGSLTHALVLQGTKYSTELEIYADGWQLKLVDAYNQPTLHLRTPESDFEEIIFEEDDDPYFGEMSAFIDAAESHHSSSAVADDEEDSGILSSFRDAANTYALTWAIKEASEKSKKTKRVV